MLDPAKLQLDVGSDTDLIIRDKETEELVMVIIHNFTCHSGLLAYMEEVVKENLQHPKSMHVCIIFHPFTSSYSSLSHSAQLVNTGKIV